MKKTLSSKQKILTSVLLASMALSVSAWATGETSQDNDLNAAANHVGSVLSHAAITAQVKTALLADSRTNAFDINVDTDGAGRVTLAGTASSLESRRAASDIASHVNGVRSVDNRLLITADRTDNPKTLSSQAQQVGENAVLTARVKAALAGDDQIVSSDISVESKGTTVLLSGDTPSVVVRAAAIDRARQVDGVTRVDASELVVDRPSRRRQ